MLVDRVAPPPRLSLAGNRVWPVSVVDEPPQDDLSHMPARGCAERVGKVAPLPYISFLGNTGRPVHT